MQLPHPSPIERHILDLLDRIERKQLDRIAALEAKVQALEAQSNDLAQRSEQIEAELGAQDKGITALSDSLVGYLGLTESLPG